MDGHTPPPRPPKPSRFSERCGDEAVHYVALRSTEGPFSVRPAPIPRRISLPGLDHIRKGIAYLANDRICVLAHLQVSELYINSLNKHYSFQANQLRKDPHFLLNQELLFLLYGVNGITFDKITCPKEYIKEYTPSCFTAIFMPVAISRHALRTAT